MCHKFSQASALQNYSCKYENASMRLLTAVGLPPKKRGLKKRSPEIHHRIKTFPFSQGRKESDNISTWSWRSGSVDLGTKTTWSFISRFHQFATHIICQPRNAGMLVKAIAAYDPRKKVPAKRLWFRLQIFGIEDCSLDREIGVS